MASSAPVELQKHLGGLDYPATKDQIIEHARANGAGEDLLRGLSGISDREYDGPNAVSSEFSRASS